MKQNSVKLGKNPVKPGKDQWEPVEIDQSRFRLGRATRPEVWGREGHRHHLIILDAAPFIHSFIPRSIHSFIHSFASHPPTPSAIFLFFFFCSFFATTSTRLFVACSSTPSFFLFFSFFFFLIWVSFFLLFFLRVWLVEFRWGMANGVLPSFT